MKLIYKVALSAAVVALPVTVQAGVIPTTATAAFEQDITFALEGAGNFAGFQNGNQALHDSESGNASLNGTNSEMWGSGCKGGQECTLSINNSVTAIASDGSAISKRVDINRKLFIQVEDTATLTVTADNISTMMTTMFGDGGSPDATASADGNMFTLDEDMIRIPTTLAAQTVLFTALPPTLPVGFTVGLGESMSFDLPFGDYSLAISGGFLEVSARQTAGSIPVSEPASLALFGLSLAGLVSVSRRKAKAVSHLR